MKYPLLLTSLTFFVVGTHPVSGDENSLLFPSQPAAQKSCTVSIKPWFSSGSVTANGAVLPANSLKFSDATNCEFYKWGWQNFLWLTTTTGKDGGLVLNSEPFFDLDLSTGALVNDAGLALRAEKNDSVDEASGNAYVWGKNNLVYFGVHTNDVWAYFTVLNLQSKAQPAANQFPTDAAQLKSIINGAQMVYGKTIQDGETLAIEIKSAWVEASAVPNPSEYVTITSEIPVYDKTTDPLTWTQTSRTKQVQLALVGIHIVGSVAGHKEMVWATFEHQSNAPNDSFKYVGTDKAEHSYSNFDANGAAEQSWLFIPKGTKKSSIPLVSSGFFAGSIEPGNNMKGSTIVSSNGKPIAGQSVYRQSPWGTGAAQPAPGKESNAQNNTDIISINQNVLGQLTDGDVRSNYVLVGATWANDLVPPAKGVVVKGSLTLANTTMETFSQSKNCFDCHNGGDLGGLSHIYNAVNPKLFKP